MQIRREVSCSPACNFGHNDLHGTMDTDIPYLTDPRYVPNAPGSYDATPFTYRDYTFTFAAPTLDRKSVV